MRWPCRNLAVIRPDAGAWHWSENSPGRTVPPPFLGWVAALFMDSENSPSPQGNLRVAAPFYGLKKPPDGPFLTASGNSPAGPFYGLKKLPRLTCYPPSQQVAAQPFLRTRKIRRAAPFRDCENYVPARIDELGSGTDGGGRFVPIEPTTSQGVRCPPGPKGTGFRRCSSRHPTQPLDTIQAHVISGLLVISVPFVPLVS